MSGSQENVVSAIKGYSEVAINSLIKPTLSILDIFLSNPTEDNLIWLNVNIRNMNEYIDFLEKRKGRQGIEIIEINQLIDLIKKYISDIKGKASKPSIAADKYSSIHESIVHQLKCNLERLESSSDLSNDRHLIYENLASCTIELMCKHSQLNGDIPNLKRKKLEEEKLELEDLQEKSKMFLI